MNNVKALIGGVIVHLLNLQRIYWNENTRDCFDIFYLMFLKVIVNFEAEKLIFTVNMLSKLIYIKARI
jgi:hypothetical protein